ncbi:protein kinase domain-containing protein [Streptomyces olivaceus]|uniref:protein kinase domain-containing protein n=1 Tax=Streptomyces olivaceus TaxID=47716 RepID=UPI0036C403C3
MSAVDLNYPAARFAEFLAGRGLVTRRTIAFAGLSTLAVVDTSASQAAGDLAVAKGLAGYYHVIDAVEPEQQPGVYGYYWYKRYGSAQHDAWRTAFAFEYATLDSLRGYDCVAQVIDGDLDGDIPYYLMHYYKRGSLAADASGRGWDLPVDFVVRVSQDVALGLGALHARGIVHRDLNAENVLLKEDGGAVIADLGCARALDAPPTEPRRRPDEFHWPPEYAESYDTASVEADIYGLGVLMYQMTVGRMPRHSGPGCAEGARIGRYPAALTTVADACLEYQPKNRPASIEEVLKQLAVV